MADKLRRMLERYPDVATGEVERLEALLHDWSPGQRREISLIVAAAAEGVPAGLTGGGAVSQRIPELARSLELDRGLAPDAARWAVESWASALRLTSAPVRELAPTGGGGGGGGG